MDPQELLQILLEARAALEQGAPYTEINKRIQELTNGQFAGLMSLALAVDPNLEAQVAQEDDLRKVAEVSPVRNFIEQLIQGGTAGFADEIVQPLSPDLARGLQERAEARRRVNPGASFLGDVAGIVASPLTRAGGSLFNLLRGTIGRVGAGAVAGGAGGGLFAAGEATGGPEERATAAGRGAAVGGLLGGGASLGAAVGGRLARPLLPSPVQARRALGNMIAQARLTPEEAAQAVRTGPPGTSLATLDPSLGARARDVVRKAPQLRAAGGPVETLLARVEPKAISSARRAIFRPLEAEVVNDNAVIGALRSNPIVSDLLRKVTGKVPSEVSELSFRQIQDIRQLIGRQLGSRSTLPSEFRELMEARAALDQVLSRALPGYAVARRQFAELVARQKDLQKLASAVDKAVPTLDTGLPASIEGITATLKNVLLNVDERRTMIAELVGETLLTEGEAGARLIEQRVRNGFFARVFKQFRDAVGRGVPRQIAPTETGRAFGAAAVPGLLTFPADPVSSPSRRRR